MNSQPSRSSSNPYNAVGLSLSMGCLMGVGALITLLLGLLLDQVFNSGRLFILICVLGGIPINLLVTLRLTQVLIKRIIPSDPPRTGAPRKLVPDERDERD